MSSATLRENNKSNIKIAKSHTIDLKKPAKGEQMTANQNKHTLWTAAKAIRLSLILALISLAGWPLTILAAHLSDVPVGDVCNLVFFSPEVFVDGFAPGKLYTLITFPY